MGIAPDLTLLSAPFSALGKDLKAEA